MRHGGRQPCLPALMRASCLSAPRSTIIRLPSGARPAQSAAPEGGRSAVGHPPCRVDNSGRVRRVAPPRLRGVLGLATVRRAGAFRRLHPRILAPCFVAGIPASSPDAGFAAHPPPRVRPPHSAQRSPAPPAPHPRLFVFVCRVCLFVCRRKRHLLSFVPPLGIACVAVDQLLKRRR